VWPTAESWTWPGWEGKPIEVEVYTKAPEVKLFLNDRLVGTKAVSRDTEFKAVFTVNYEPGTLRAEVTLPASSAPLTATDAAASASSWQISATKLETAGLPAALRLTPDRTAIAADGQDLAYVTVEVVDKRGNVCPEAAIPCEATVRGAATLLAFATADLKDRELYTSPRVTTFQGRALLVVRSAKKGGRADVSIRSKLGTAKVGILCAHK
jgi:beta-galactosidase